MDDLIDKLAQQVLELQKTLEIKEDLIDKLEGDLAMADAEIELLRDKL